MKNQIVLALLVVSTAGTAQAMNLEQYLEQVKAKHKSLQALEYSKEAVELNRLSGDVELAPRLTLAGGYLSDKKLPNQYSATEIKANQYSAELAKRFSTGTSVALSAEAVQYEIMNSQLNTVPGKFATGSLGVSVEQSLWKNGFGGATRLRWEREESVAKAQSGAFDLQQRALLVQAEASFWDYLTLQEEIKIKKASLDRAKRIETWVKRRFADGIADKADLLNAQALVAARELQLVDSEDQFQAAIRGIRDVLELDPTEAVPTLEGNITNSRPISSMIQGQGKVVKIDAYLSSLESKAKSSVAREVEDGYSADLVLSGSYKTNSYEENLNKATAEWDDGKRPTSQVGLRWVYLFDVEAKKGAVGGARKEALAAKLTSERKMLESDSAWIEINRRYIELGKRVDAARKISQLQMARAVEETNKFNKGRSITSNVITAEEDAAEAELNLTKLLAEQRKLEAQGRLFMAVEGDL